MTVVPNTAAARNARGVHSGVCQHFGRSRTPFRDEAVEQGRWCGRMPGQLLRCRKPAFGVGVVEKVHHDLLELPNVGWIVFGFAHEHVDEHPQ